MFTSPTARQPRAIAWTGALLSGALLFTGCSGDGDTERPTATAGSSNGAPSGSTTSALGDLETSLQLPPVTPGEPLGDDLVEATQAERTAWVAGAKTFWTEITRVLKDPETTAPAAPAPEFTGVTGAAEDELRNLLDEFALNGWAVRGKARVLDSQVVQRSDDPASVVLRVCLDNSRVAVIEADGTNVPNSTPQNSRTLNLIQLVEQDGAWVVSEQRPAASPDC